MAPDVNVAAPLPGAGDWLTAASQSGVVAPEGREAATSTPKPASHARSSALLPASRAAATRSLVGTPESSAGR